jgi:hypothetical protein
MRWVLSGVMIGLSVFAVGPAHAEPTPPPPAPGTSSSDELADMVMDVIQHGGPAVPTTTPVPAPPQ